MNLTRRDTEYVIHVNGKTLMSSRLHGSEEELATLACGPVAARDQPHVLVGGLGMGFTLRSTLDQLPATATVTVAELIPAIVEWNRGPLGELTGYPLRDPRVRVEQQDVALSLRAQAARFDAIMLDVDNGPTAFTTSENLDLYGNEGIAAASAALRDGGVLAVWSAWDDKKFEHRLRYHGFDSRKENVRARLKKGGAQHVIFVGIKPS